MIDEITEPSILYGSPGKDYWLLFPQFVYKDVASFVGGNRKSNLAINELLRGRTNFNSFVSWLERWVLENKGFN